ncbi:MAG: helix-turn-helix domain-containing protein [Candidatus Pacebacteria bacterium]|nr:helix-turn-helix domain-containing protein [Candidatus Paceibacterota bacterium]
MNTLVRDLSPDMLQVKASVDPEHPTVSLIVTVDVSKIPKFNLAIPIMDKHGRLRRLTEVMTDYFELAVQAHGGNQKQTADAIGISRTTLAKWTTRARNRERRP